MIYVTGDMHGDINRINSKKLKKLKKRDTLIICGDFGFIWTGDKKEKKLLKKIGKKKYNVLFVDGCHENFDELYKYELEEWNGGKVRHISGNLRHLSRGEIFEIEGKKIFAFGGGQSAEPDMISEGENFWIQELPTVKEITYAAMRLNDYHDTVDYIITHEPPANLKEFVEDKSDEKLHINQLNTAFKAIYEVCEFKKWFFGKCHKNKRISSKFQACFDEVYPIDTL